MDVYRTLRWVSKAGEGGGVLTSTPVKAIRRSRETEPRDQYHGSQGSQGKKKGFRKRKGDRWLQKEKSDGIRTEKRLRRGASYWSLHSGYR